jgi:hypothetical protein
MSARMVMMKIVCLSNMGVFCSEKFYCREKLKYQVNGGSACVNKIEEPSGSYIIFPLCLPRKSPFQVSEVGHKLNK